MLNRNLYNKRTFNWFQMFSIPVKFENLMKWTMEFKLHCSNQMEIIAPLSFCLGCRVFGMWDVWDVGCFRCGMREMWDIWGVGCSGCGMFGMWVVGDMGCLGCGMFEMWDVRDVGCLGCELLEMRDVWDVGCLGCEMFRMFGMWDIWSVKYLGYRIFWRRNTEYVGCSGCGMLGMWNVGDVGYFGYGMWDVGCLPGCWMLIYKMSLIDDLFSWIGLIFTSQPNLVIESGVHSLLHENCHHQIILAKFNWKVLYPPPYEQEIWHFNKENFDHIRKAIFNFQWENEMNANEMVYFLHKINTKSHNKWLHVMTRIHHGLIRQQSA